MSTSTLDSFRRLIPIRLLPLLLACLLAACGRKEQPALQGYVEGEFMYIASPSAGVLRSLRVQKGTTVKKGEPLFALEPVGEKASRDEAERRLAQARAALEDAKRGKRPSEVASIEAQLRQGREAVALSEKELARVEKLFAGGVVSAQDLDRARTSHELNRQRVAQLTADLETARLGARSGQVEGAAEEVRARGAALDRVKWELSEKSRKAPADALVFDTLFREGEWVPAGRPVVVLLPPSALKVRAFVPEAKIGSVRMGQPVRVRMDGVTEAPVGRVTFVSPRAEFTPPVIYSRESRGKLVFMIEASFDAADAAKLHPGQPVDVELGL